MIAPALTTAMALLLAAAAAADPPIEGLAPYSPLAGHCWRGTFPDGKTTDEHCYSWVYGGRHLRDVHVVRGEAPEYRGETIYSWDAQNGRIVFRYWNSDGGYSDGDILIQDGALVSPEERYSGEDGREQVFRSRLLIVDDDNYEAQTETLRDGAWREAWRIRFAKVGPATPRGRAARQQAQALAGLAPFVGRWIPDPADSALEQRPDAADDVVLHLEFGPQHKLVRVYEHYPITGTAADATVEGIAYYDHLANAIRFDASSTHGWTFHGTFSMPTADTLVREYDVHYARGETYMPHPEWGGQVRRYREVWKLITADRIASTLDIERDGRWEPFGAGKYALARY